MPQFLAGPFVTEACGLSHDLELAATFASVQLRPKAGAEDQTVVMPGLAELYALFLWRSRWWRSTSAAWCGNPRILRDVRVLV